MSDVFWLSEAQMGRIELHIPLTHGVAPIDDRRVISGVTYVVRNRLRWADGPAAGGTH